MKRETINSFLIDGTPLLDPDSGIEYEEEDLLCTDGGRDEAGYMHNIVMRYGVKKWRFVYSILTAAEYAYIKKLFRGKTTFTFTFKDEEGKIQQTTAYCTKHNTAYWSARRGLYKDLEFEIIEC